jgi:hypothetical protein
MPASRELKIPLNPTHYEPTRKKSVTRPGRKGGVGYGQHHLHRQQRENRETETDFLGVSSPLGNPPTIENAGQLVYSPGLRFSSMRTFTSFTDTNGQQVSLENEKSLISSIAIDSVGNYVCVGATEIGLSIHRFQLVTGPQGPFGTLYSLKRINYAKYNDIYTDIQTQLIAVQSKPMNQNQADYVIVTRGLDPAFYFFNVSSGSITPWGTLTPLPIYTVLAQFGITNASTSFLPVSITIDYFNILHVAEGNNNDIYSFDLNNGCQLLATTRGGKNIFNNVALNFGSSLYYNMGTARSAKTFNIIAAGKTPKQPDQTAGAGRVSSLIVADVVNQRLLTLTMSKDGYTADTAQISSGLFTQPFSQHTQLGIALDNNGLIAMIQQTPELYPPPDLSIKRIDNNTAQSVNFIILSNDDPNNLTGKMSFLGNTWPNIQAANFAIDKNGFVVFVDDTVVVSPFVSNISITF